MSDYVRRLRAELVDAAARERAGVPARRRIRPRRAVPALAAAAIVAALVLAVSAIELASDEEPVVSPPAESALTYRVTPFPAGDTSAAAERSAAVLRARIAAAGIDGATVSVAGDRVGVDADGAAVAKVSALAVPGRLAIYDWEASVLGRNGRPAPGAIRYTSDPGAGVSQYDAVVRAEKAQGSGGPPVLWLIDDATREVLRGPQWSRDALLDGGSVPAGARVAEAPGGVRVVSGPGEAPERWYAVADSAALGNADVAAARAANDPVADEPVVAIDLTSKGQAAFEALTREIARRGQAERRPGENPILAAQHFAIVLDDELANVPFIDFTQAPDGIDGRGGVHIQGGLTRERAEEIATLLDTGAMPAALVPLEDGAP